MFPFLNLFFVSFVVAFLMIPAIRPLAFYVGLVDKPGGRKRHSGSVPLTGGISIFLALLISVFFELIPGSMLVRLLIVGAGLMVLIGALDDRLDISARIRLLAQALIALIFVYGLGVKITDIGEIGDILIRLPTFLSLILSVTAVIATVNAFNMLDGVDGLVGTLAMISFGGLAVIARVMGVVDIVGISVCLVAAILAFLIFNVYGSTEKRSFSKAFMGDAGSMFLGLILSVLLLSLQGGGVTSTRVSPLVVLWFVLFPITDMATTIYRRVRAGRSPLAADRTHIHHIMLRMGFGKYQVVVLLSLLQTLLVSVGIFVALGYVSDSVAYILAASFIAAYQYAIHRCWKMIRWIRRYFSVNKLTAGI